LEPTVAPRPFPKSTPRENLLSRELLICIINQEDKVERVLSSLAELGVTGATVIESRGMVGQLPEDAPVLAGLKDLMARSRPGNKTILSVIESAEETDAVVKMVSGILGDMESAESGVLFTVPVTRALGLRRGNG